MTKDQLHTAFKIELDKSGNMGYPAFLPEEIDYWLDKALYQVISNKFTGNNTLKQPFEKSVKRIHDLESLITTKNEAITEVTGKNQLICTTLLQDVLFFVEAVLGFDDVCSDVQLIEHSNLNSFIQTYDNIPWIEKPVAVMQGGNLVICIDPVSMKSISGGYNVKLTYVKKPTDATDLPEHVQYEIVSRAVVLALENIESPRVQTKTQLNQIDE